MLEFQKLEKERIATLAPYFAAQRLHLGDFSLAFQFMWSKTLKPDYCMAGGCLVIREFYAGKYWFHYPLSLKSDLSEEAAALEEIERYCRDKEQRLHFTNVPKSKLFSLVTRYGEASISNNRRWRDYLYRAEDFKTYAGKKFAGQRNHVNKFLKLYPDWRFHPFAQADLENVQAFLREYEGVQRSKHTYVAEEEMDEVFALLPHIGELKLLAGILEVNGKTVGFSVGERCGDMIVVHIEKALRDFEGAYPFLARQFALMFCGEGIDYLNRMDDAGDKGLRKSKLQYNPVELVDKYNVTPGRAIDALDKLPVIGTERLTLAPVRAEDERAYARLASDIERNRYWGYDWRTDYKEGTPPDRYYMDCAREDFKHRREVPLGIYCGEKLVGEVVLHRFGYAAEVEVGARVLPEEEGKGYAREAVAALTEFAFLKLNAERVEAKCFKENERSKKMLLGAGMREDGEDETYFYFYKTAAM